jgi:hypothetical protein
MSGKLELVWEEKGLAVPLFDANKGSTVITATPRGMKRIQCRCSRYMLKMYPISHRMLKAVGDAADVARKENIYFSTLLTDRERNEVGFAAFKE